MTAHSGDGSKQPAMAPTITTPPVDTSRPSAKGWSVPYPIETAPLGYLRHENVTPVRRHIATGKDAHGCRGRLPSPLHEVLTEYVGK